MPLKIMWVHNHACALKGEKVATYPESLGGCSFIIPPTCEETMTELVRVDVEKT